MGTEEMKLKRSDPFVTRERLIFHVEKFDLFVSKRRLGDRMED